MTHFREESVEAVNLLAFLEESVVLGNTAKGEFVHQVDLVRFAHPLVLLNRKKR